MTWIRPQDPAVVGPPGTERKTNFMAVVIRCG